MNQNHPVMPATVASSAAISSFCSELSCKEKGCQKKSKVLNWLAKLRDWNCLTLVNFGTIIKEEKIYDDLFASANINMLKINIISLLKLNNPLLVTVHLRNINKCVGRFKISTLFCSFRIIVIVWLLNASLLCEEAQ